MSRLPTSFGGLPGVVLVACMVIAQAEQAQGAEEAGWTFAAHAAEKCRLSSPQVAMFDGYQETSVQLHVTPTGIYLQSKAPLDTGRGDNGLQVEADSPEARALLRDAEADLATYAGFAAVDLAALQAEIGRVEDERAQVVGHKWFQDYSRNPVNAARLDRELAAAEQQLAPLREQRQGAQAYLEAERRQATARQQLARLPTFPLVLSSELEERKKLHFGPARADLLAAFGSGAAVRAQLRFWPTWPETGTHEARLTLGGFNQALAQFQACAGQG